LKYVLLTIYYLENACFFLVLMYMNKQDRVGVCLEGKTLTDETLGEFFKLLSSANPKIDLTKLNETEKAKVYADLKESLITNLMNYAHLDKILCPAAPTYAIGLSKEETIFQLCCKKSWNTVIYGFVPTLDADINNFIDILHDIIVVDGNEELIDKFNSTTIKVVPKQSLLDFRGREYNAMPFSHAFKTLPFNGKTAKELAIEGINDTNVPFSIRCKKIKEIIEKLETNLKTRERSDTPTTVGSDDLTVSSSGKSDHSSDHNTPVKTLSQSKIKELVEINLNYKNIVEFEQRNEYLKNFEKEIAAIDDKNSLVILVESLTTEKNRYWEEWSNISHTKHPAYKNSWGSDNEAEVNNIKHQYYELAGRKLDVVESKLKQVKHLEQNDKIIKSQIDLVGEFVNDLLINKNITKKPDNLTKLKNGTLNFKDVYSDIFQGKYTLLDQVENKTELVNDIVLKFNNARGKHKVISIAGGRKTKKSKKPRKTKKPRKYRKKQTRRM